MFERSRVIYSIRYNVELSKILVHALLAIKINEEYTINTFVSCCEDKLLLQDLHRYISKKYLSFSNKEMPEERIRLNALILKVAEKLEFLEKNENSSKNNNALIQFLEDTTLENIKFFNILVTNIQANKKIMSILIKGFLNGTDTDTLMNKVIDISENETLLFYCANYLPDGVNKNFARNKLNEIMTKSRKTIIDIY